MLKGNLKETSIISLLKLLSKAKVTGKLTLETSNSEAQVFFDNGNITAAFLEDTKGYEALLVVSKLEEGNFSFEEGVTIPVKQFEEGTEELLKKIEEDIQLLKYTKMKPVLKPTTAENIELTKQEWNVIVEIPWAQSVSQIASKLTTDELEITKVIKSLKDKGLVELQEAATPSVREISTEAEASQSEGTKTAVKISQEFWKELMVEFAKIKGPIAEAIVEDTLASLGKTFNNASYREANKVIELLTEEIEDKEKAEEFKRQALDILKKYEE